MWAVTTKGEFFIYDQEKDNFHSKNLNQNIKKQFESIHLQCLLVDKENIFWLGTWEGLIKLEMSEQQVFKYNYSSLNPNSLAGDMVFNIAEDEFEISGSQVLMVV